MQSMTATTSKALNFVDESSSGSGNDDFLGFDMDGFDDDASILEFLEDGEDCDTRANEASAGNKRKAPSGPPKRRRRKRVRRMCTIDGCTNRVVQGGVCIAHGAKRKQCNYPGCDKSVKKAGLCSTHGPARKRCEVPGCQRVAVQNGICIGHGAKKTLCTAEGCKRPATVGLLCNNHSTNKDTTIQCAPCSPVFEPQATMVPPPAVASLEETPNFQPPAMIQPSQEFQRAMQERTMLVFEEMMVGKDNKAFFGSPLPPPPPLHLQQIELPPITQQLGTDIPLPLDLQADYDKSLDLGICFDFDEL
eukprot:Nitzschia sp. Nitz4//scaffold6_size259037//106308//107222//NITZ4_001069-RA/size259037-processed-gene-0.69-mRNA-1//-1//CDS//3329556878//6550//frame0